MQEPCLLSHVRIYNKSVLEWEIAVGLRYKVRCFKFQLVDVLSDCSEVIFFSSQNREGLNLRLIQFLYVVFISHIMRLLVMWYLSFTLKAKGKIYEITL